MEPGYCQGRGPTGVLGRDWAWGQGWCTVDLDPSLASQLSLLQSLMKGNSWETHMTRCLTEVHTNVSAKQKLLQIMKLQSQLENAWC